MRSTASRILFVCIVAASGLFACAREHHLDGYGRQTRTFFARQRVHVAAADGSPSGLDSEESALIKASYRRSLGEQSAESNSTLGSRVLMVEDKHDVPKTP